MSAPTIEREGRMTLRHSWAPPIRLAHETRRPCQRPGCNIVKVTWHQPGERPWQEFWRGSADHLAWKIEGERTPECEGVVEEARAA